MSHHVVRLSDGHRVGVMTGGTGVPLVFLHGIALNTRVYTRFLSRLSACGFRVIAIDAASHGRTAPLPISTFRASVDLTVRTMDALGIRRAIVVGHSMGGRATIELSAAVPERVIGAVLLDAAAGDAFDANALKTLHSLTTVPLALASSLYDTAADWWRSGSWRERRLYGTSLAAALALWSRQPQALTAVMRAVAGSDPTNDLLRQARAKGVPFIVIHAKNDLVVPWANAVVMARHAGAALHTVPRAYHSWMIADPRRGADTLDSLMTLHFTETLERIAAEGESIDGPNPFLVPGALAMSLGNTAEVG